MARNKNSAHLQSKAFKRLFFLLFGAYCLVLVQKSGASALPADPLSCPSWLLDFQSSPALPAAIEHTPQPRYAEEVSEAGVWISFESLVLDSKPLRNLSSEHYVFLITSTGDVALSPKFLLEERGDSQTGLVTHKSLLTLLQQQLGSSVEILGSGEFEILNGQTRWISNRSGNFRGNESNFRFSLHKLLSLGLPLRAHTEQRLTDPNIKEDWGHTPESSTYDQFQLQQRRLVFSSEESRLAFRKFRMLYEVLARHWPGERPGEARLQDFMDFALPVFFQAKAYDNVDYFFRPMIYASNADGMFFGVRLVEEGVGYRLSSIVDDSLDLFIRHSETPEPLRAAFQEVRNLR